MKKITATVFLLSVFTLSILASGCETSKGLVKGVGYAAGGAAAGTVKDAKNFWQFLEDADQWFKRNLW